jgi:hypothetical protein
MFRETEKSLALLQFKPQIIQIVDYATSVQKKKEKGLGGAWKGKHVHMPLMRGTLRCQNNYMCGLLQNFIQLPFCIVLLKSMARK